MTKRCVVLVGLLALAACRRPTPTGTDAKEQPATAPAPVVVAPTTNAGAAPADAPVTDENKTANAPAVVTPTAQAPAVALAKNGTRHGRRPTASSNAEAAPAKGVTANVASVVASPAPKSDSFEPTAGAAAQKKNSKKMVDEDPYGAGATASNTSKRMGDDHPF